MHKLALYSNYMEWHGLSYNVLPGYLVSWSYHGPTDLQSYLFCLVVKAAADLWKKQSLAQYPTKWGQNLNKLQIYSFAKQ